MNLTVLKDLREWMALGFYEAIDEAYPASYGRAFKRLYENMDIRILPERLLFPCEPMENCRTMESHGVWTAESMILNFHHSSGTQICYSIAEEKKQRFPQHAAFIDELINDLKKHIQHFGGYTHSNPDIMRVLSEGFLAMKSELDDELEKAQNQEELNFLRAMQDYAEAVLALHKRTLQSLDIALKSDLSDERRKDLSLIRKEMERAFLYPADSFIGALLAVHFTWMLDACDSIGNFDQVLAPFWEKDSADGILDKTLARRLLDEFWKNFQRFNGWNLQIGGRGAGGNDSCSIFTMECLEACRRNNIPRPNVAFRINSDTPEKYILKAFEVLGGGSGRPALYNEDLYLETLMKLDLGLSREDVFSLGFGGCTETMISGLSNVGSLDGEINLGVCLMLAMNNGYDPVRNLQTAPETGDFADFNSFGDFLDALKIQIKYAVDSFVDSCDENLKMRFTNGDPKLYRSFFTRDCVRNHRSFEAGGARYNWSVVCFQGIATMIDSVTALRKLVFEEKAISKSDLLTALAKDFKGYETLQQRLLAASKYGNDDFYTDSIGKEIMEFACRELSSHRTPRGGRYLGSCIIFHTFEGAGKKVSATPDGRNAFTVLPDSAGPVPGRDTHGPTALLKSVTSLPLSMMTGTPVVNLRLSKKMMSSESELMNCVKLLKTYFDLGGMQLQISVVSTEDMRAAQEKPEEWKDLIVRIGGFSTYFNSLSPAMQDSVIKRSEQSL